jgi:phage terminase small subunit
MKLTPKQQLFIEYYIVSMNATESAIKAGYSEKTANVVGYENLTKPYIKDAINKALENRVQEHKLTAEYVLTSLQNVADRCMQKEPILDKSGQPTGEYRFDSSGANKALELLGKHMRLFIEKQEISTETTVNNKIDLSGFTAEQLKEMLK